jgi:hypothetical protein
MLFLVTFITLVCSSYAAQMKGFVLTTYSEGVYSNPLTLTNLLEYANSGATHIEIMWTWFVDNSVNSTKIYPISGRSPNQQDIISAITFAQSVGLTVALKPHIDCNDGIWRANIGTKYQTEQQWVDFFSNYSAFMKFTTDVAASTNVNIVNIGTELDGSFVREQNWRAIIAQVRQALPQAVLFVGPNWSWTPVNTTKSYPGYQLVKFWDALDFIGVDAYFPMSSQNDPSVAEVIASWAPIAADMKAFSEANGNKPFLFPEIGYASFQQAGIAPYACCSGAPDLATQAVLFEGFFEAIYNQPWFAGVFWWAWDAGLRKGGSKCSTDFNVMAKPAFDVMTTWYNSSFAKPARNAPPMSVHESASASVYSNGVFSNGFSAISYGVNISTTDTSNPYPGHQYSLLTNYSTHGALILYSPNFDVSPYTHVSFDIIISNVTLSIALQATVCTCDSCGQCGDNPGVVTLVDYMDSACSLAPSWSSQAVHVSVPLADIVPAGAKIISQFHIADSGDGSDHSPLQAIVDNVSFN